MPARMFAESTIPLSATVNDIESHGYGSSLVRSTSLAFIVFKISITELITANPLIVAAVAQTLMRSHFGNAILRDGNAPPCGLRMIPATTLVASALIVLTSLVALLALWNTIIIDTAQTHGVITSHTCSANTGIEVPNL